MNFLDELLNKRLNGEDFIGEISLNIYDNDSLRELLANYPQFVADAIAIVDFDTDMNMDGDIFVNDNDKADDIIMALSNCGLNHDAEILKNLKNLYENSEDLFWSDEGQEYYSKLFWETDNNLFWDYVIKYFDKALFEYFNHQI